MIHAVSAGSGVAPKESYGPTPMGLCIVAIGKIKAAAIHDLPAEALAQAGSRLTIHAVSAGLA